MTQVMMYAIFNFIATIAMKIPFCKIVITLQFRQLLKAGALFPHTQISSAQTDIINTFFFISFLKYHRCACVLIDKIDAPTASNPGNGRLLMASM